MTHTETLKMALEALEAADWYIDQLEMIVYCVDDEGTHENRAKVQIAITAFKEALSQPTTGDYALGYAEGFNDACKKPAQQEPVAWRKQLTGAQRNELKQIDDGTWEADRNG